MKPFGWFIAVFDGVLGAINLGWCISHPNLISIAAMTIVLSLGAIQIYVLNTEEVNEIPTQIP
jgi:hypothetical protein